MSSCPRLTHVEIRNYKSIEYCRVALAPLTFMLGPNGAGKSNFLDAIAFVRDAVQKGMAAALSDSDISNNSAYKRLGPGEIIHRRRMPSSPEDPACSTGFKLEFQLSENKTAYYRIGLSWPAYFIENRVSAISYSIFDEEFCIQTENEKFLVIADIHGSENRQRTVRTSRQIDNRELPEINQEELYLHQIKSHNIFSELYNAISEMGFYSPDIKFIKNPTSTRGPSNYLLDNGVNICAFTERDIINNKHTFNMIHPYISEISEISDVFIKNIGGYAIIGFSEIDTSTLFFPLNISDGTLSAYMNLVAMFQPEKKIISLEEPENFLHPTAANTMRHALMHAAESKQIIVTTHSPDLLHSPDIPAESILIAEKIDGATRITPVDDESRRILAEKIYTPGEMLHHNMFSIKND